MLSLVYDPGVMTAGEAADAAAPYGIGHIESRPGAGGWFVERRSWAGIEDLGQPPPVGIAADPGENPIVTAVKHRQATEGVLADLADDTIDLAALRTNLARLRAYLGVANPTNAQAISATKALAAVELDIVRYLLQRGRV